MIGAELVGTCMYMCILRIRVPVPVTLLVYVFVRVYICIYSPMYKCHIVDLAFVDRGKSKSC